MQLKTYFKLRPACEISYSTFYTYRNNKINYYVGNSIIGAFKFNLIGLNLYIHLEDYNMFILLNNYFEIKNVLNKILFQLDYILFATYKYNKEQSMHSKKIYIGINFIVGEPKDIYYITISKHKICND